MQTMLANARLGFVLLLLCGFELHGAPSQGTILSEFAMNKGAGAGSHLVVKVRLEDGQELPFLVDTGSPITLLDRSMAQQLGEPLSAITVRSLGGEQDSKIYAAPNLWLGNLPLKTDPYVATFNFKGWMSRLGIKGVLGMDILRRYCVQLDFEAGKVRILERDNLNRAELGKAFPLVFSSEGQHPPSLAAQAGQNAARPFIHHTGLLGGSNTNLLLDTGDNVDGAVEQGVITGHYLTRLTHFFIRMRALRLPQCVWNGNTYTKLRIWQGRNQNQLGLRFFARHLVTFDFPGETLYLKQTRIILSSHRDGRMVQNDLAAQ